MPGPDIGALGATAPDITITDDDEDDTGNLEAAELCSLNSSEISTVETVLFEAQTRRESEYHVFGLVCEAKWDAAMVYYKQQHKTRWGGAASGVVGASATESFFLLHDDDENKVVAEEILALYCQILAERGESEFCIKI